MKKYLKMREALIALVALVILGVFLKGSLYWAKFLSEIFIMGVYALSVGLLMGYVGLISFGHAAFFGLGSYLVAAGLSHFSLPLSLCVPASLVIIFAIALMIGFLSSRLSGIQFAVGTLAFAQLFWTLAMKLRWITNGEDGMTVDFSAYAYLTSPFVFLCLSGAFFLASFCILKKITESPFGYLIRSIKENEMRVPFMGFSPTVIKMFIFAISSVFAGMAGILQLVLKHFVAPDSLYWTMSGSAVVMSLVGGVGSLLGPFLGAAIILVLQDFVSAYTEHWMIIVGAILTVIVICEPSGVIGLARRMATGEQRQSQRGPDLMENGKEKPSLAK